MPRPRLAGRRPPTAGAAGRAAAHAVAAAAAALITAGTVLAVAGRDASARPGAGFADGAHVWTELVLASAFTAAGWLLASRRPGVVFGWLALAAGTGHALAAAGEGWAVVALDGGHDLPFASLALLAGTMGEPLETLVLAATWAAFPSGRLPRGGTGWAARLSIGLCGAGWLYGLVSPFPAGQLPEAFAGLSNPLDAGLPAWQPVPLFASGMLLGSAVVVVRWLRAGGEERQVLRWLAVVNVGAILVTPLVVALPAGELISSAGTVVMLVVVIAVVLRNQVYGIDAVLNRTLVYVLLTAFVAALYAAGVGVLALLGQAAGGPWTVVVAVGAAFSLAPVRLRVQRLVNRFLYGERDEPYTVIGRIASRLEAAGSIEHLLPGLLEAVAGALRLPSAAVEMRGDDGATRRIAHGAARPDAAVVRFPLAHQGRDIGALAVTLRAGQRALDARETRLMRDIARQVAVAASNVLLTEALVRSRERIVQAAEEERRRLRHDLHDGLGPVLTAAATKVDAARNLAARDTGRATDLLGRVRADLSAALGDLRRLVYALRPPALDELGLLGALREHLGHAAVPVTLTAPDALPRLPAAVEIAAYRIVTEAVTNVVRHAAASACTVTIGCAERLTLEIRDDGTSGAAWTPGVGLTSMRERAAALGGTWTAGPADGGGRVFAELPLALAAALPGGAP
ncbi:sensor histidine kinase [Actinomadura sp. NPDC048394]|uniref:sensor histidine kinase n=1 Tax=Actinomadura sp. NPDC048394 TaxID=3158223 RepID=UPI0033D9CEF1